MSTYVECRVCGFVLRAVDASRATPKHWETCPDCGGADFVFPGR